MNQRVIEYFAAAGINRGIFGVYIGFQVLVAKIDEVSQACWIGRRFSSYFG